MSPSSTDDALASFAARFPAIEDDAPPAASAMASSSSNSSSSSSTATQAGGGATVPAAAAVPPSSASTPLTTTTVPVIDPFGLGGSRVAAAAPAAASTTAGGGGGGAATALTVPDGAVANLHRSAPNTPTVWPSSSLSSSSHSPWESTSGDGGGGAAASGNPFRRNSDPFALSNPLPAASASPSWPDLANPFSDLAPRQSSSGGAGAGAATRPAYANPAVLSEFDPVGSNALAPGGLNNGSLVGSTMQLESVLAAAPAPTPPPPPYVNPLLLAGSGASVPPPPPPPGPPPPLSSTTTASAQPTATVSDEEYARLVASIESSGANPPPDTSEDERLARLIATGMDLGAGGAGTGDGSGADTAADEALARRLASTGVAETDEELARRLQQEAQDEELARRLAAGDQQPPPTLPPRPSNGGDVLPSYNAVAAAPSAAAPLVQPPPIPARPVAIVPFVHRKLTIRPGPNLRSYLVHEGVQLLYQLETPATMRYGWDAHLFSNQLNAVTLTTRRDLNQKGFNVFNPLAAHTHTIVTRKAKFPRFVYSFLGFDGMYYSWEDTSLFRVMGNYKLTVAFLHGGLLSLSRQLEIFTEGLHMVDLILATYFGRLILERDQP